MDALRYFFLEALACVIDGDFIRPEGGSILAYSLSDLFNEDISYDEVDWVREGPAREDGKP